PIGKRTVGLESKIPVYSDRKAPRNIEAEKISLIWVSREGLSPQSPAGRLACRAEGPEPPRIIKAPSLASLGNLAIPLPPCYSEKLQSKVKHPRKPLQAATSGERQKSAWRKTRTQRFARKANAKTEFCSSQTKTTRARATSSSCKNGATTSSASAPLKTPSRSSAAFSPIPSSPTWNFPA